VKKRNRGVGKKENQPSDTEDKKMIEYMKWLEDLIEKENQEKELIKTELENEKELRRSKGIMMTL